jgi:peroxiredoxin
VKPIYKFSIILLCGLMGVVAIVLCQRILERHRVKPDTAPTGLIGSRLPGGTLINLQTNHNEYENIKKGKVLLLFLTTDCDACRKEVGNVSQVLPALASKVAVFGVGIEDRDEVTAFAEKNRMNFPILLDHGAVILNRLGFKFMPTKVLLRDGVITKIWYGTSPDNAALIRDLGE